MTEPEVIFTEIRCSECGARIQPQAATVFVRILPGGALITAQCNNADLCRGQRYATS